MLSGFARENLLLARGHFPMDVVDLHQERLDGAVKEAREYYAQNPLNQGEPDEGPKA